MKSKHLDIITILIGVILFIIISVIWNTKQAQCQFHSNISIEQIKNLPQSFYIENVPFYDYTMINAKSCMPASLGMVMGFYDNITTPDELDEKFPELGWSLDNFKQYAKSKGYKVEDYESSIEDLKLKISEGKPVIVSQWVDLYHKWGMYGHVRVVVGYTDKYFITFDPVPSHGKNYNISFSDFEKLWNRGVEGGCNRVLLVYK
jgi:hypothetical protein